MGAPDRSPDARGRPRLRAVLFDAGNTLIYMPHTPEEMLQRLCGEFGVAVTLDQARAAYLASQRYYAENYLGYVGDQGQFWRRYHAEALRVLGIEDPTGEKANYLSVQSGAPGVWQPYPEAESVCRRLRSMGLKLGVVSNGPDTVVQMLSQTGLLPFFETVVASQSVGVEKPDPRIFEFALQRIGVVPWETLFVGDIYEVDVVGARAAGIAGVLIDRQGERGECDCPVVRSLAELIPLVES